MNLPSLRMEPMRQTHDRSHFECGDEALDRYLQQQAGQDMKRDIAAVIVATLDGSPSVLGFYTLSAASIDLSSLPEATRKKLPRYGRIPAVLLGRLAVANEMRGMGLGELLLADAVKRACRGEIAWAVFVVRAKHDDAAAFYRHFGFMPFEGDPLMLWIARKSAFDAISRQDDSGTEDM